MDITGIGKKVGNFCGKYRYVLIILLVGIGLMLVPWKQTEKKESTDAVQAVQSDYEQSESLRQLLAQIEGVGKVKLLLTFATGETTVYQVDEGKETVVITDDNRAQHGLVTQTLPPKYLGAVVVCQGAENTAVRLAVTEAVADATGLGTDQISVLKMK